METLKENQELLLTINARQQMIKELFEEIKQDIASTEKNAKTINELWDECLEDQPHALAI